uniref:Transmembrane protein n=1 Tax=Caenorhabditis tropicalis TaxID=1561998 RepID=A0A1I7TV34_9PELO
MSGRPSIVIDFPRKVGANVEFSRVRHDTENTELSKQPKKLECGWLPCCMSPEDAESFGHHVSIFMVALVAFATFFCVTFILVLVFILG